MYYPSRTIAFYSVGKSSHGINYYKSTTSHAFSLKLSRIIGCLAIATELSKLRTRRKDTACIHG